MRIVVKEEQKAYYNLRLYYGGEIIENYTGKKCPSWGTEIEPLQGRKVNLGNCTPDKTEKIKVENVTEEPTIPIEETQTQQQNDDYEKLSQLLDEAVNLDITYEPSLMTDIQKQIEELEQLIKQKLTENKNNGFQ